MSIFPHARPRRTPRLDRPHIRLVSTGGGGRVWTALAPYQLFWLDMPCAWPPISKFIREHLNDASGRPLRRLT